MRARFRGKAWIGIVILVLSAVMVRAFVVRSTRLGSGQVRWATGTASIGMITVSVNGSGALQPGHTDELRTTVAGSVRQVLARNGDDVEQGQTLLVLENEAVMLAWEQARLTYEAETERLEEMLSGEAGNVKSTALRAAELKVEQARLALEARQRAVDELTVRAKGTGQVGQVEVKPGDEVPAGALLLTMQESDRARVRLNVPEDRIAELSLGDRASVMLGPLPEMHVVRLVLDEVSVYGLRVGDLVEATIAGEWTSSQSVTSRGAIVSIQSKTGRLFEVICRLPGVPANVPPGASAPYILIYPSGDQAKGLTITAAGNITIETDVWGLEQRHLEDLGHAARVASLAGQGTRVGSGPVMYQVTLELDQALDAARGGMSAHAAIWPGDGGQPLFGLTVLEFPSGKVTASSAGKVIGVAVAEGDRVNVGEVLVLLDNSTVRWQLDQARNDLEIQINALSDLTRPQYTERELRAQEIRVRQAELALDAREADVKALRVTAPRKGRVSGLNTNLVSGRDVTAGTQICRLLNYDSMTLVVQVDELEVDRLAVGMPAEVTVDALPGQVFQAEVSDISQEGTYTQGVSRFAVTIAVESSPRLRSQMTAAVRIFVTEKDGALLVPSEAVLFLGLGEGEVTVLEPSGQAKVRPVTVGLHNSKHVEILSGLVAGDKVVTGVVTANNRPFDWRNPRSGVLR